jgi:hypothetical protein
MLLHFSGAIARIALSAIAEVVTGASARAASHKQFPTFNLNVFHNFSN